MSILSITDIGAGMVAVLWSGVIAANYATADNTAFLFNGVTPGGAASNGGTNKTNLNPGSPQVDNTWLLQHQPAWLNNPVIGTLTGTVL